MSTEVGAIHYDLDLDNKKFNKGMKGASRSLATMKRRMASARAGSMALLGGLAALGAGAAIFGVKSVQAFNEQEKAMAKLNNLVLNVEGNTQKHVQALADQASALQQVGVVGDEVIISGQSQLATFALQGDAIKNLTPAMVDMVANLKGVNATQEDMMNIGNLVGKVMQGQVGALGRYGVSLTEAQADQLKMGTEMERSVLLAEVLTANYGGVNEAIGKTFGGKMARAKNNFGDFMEVMGGAIASTIKPLVESFNNWFESVGGAEGVMNKLRESFEKIEPFLPIIIGALVFGLIPAFWGLAASIWAMMAPLIPFLIIGALLGVLVKKLIDKYGGLDEIMKKLQPTIDILKVAFNIIWEAIKDLWKTIQEQLMPALRDFWKMAGPVIIPVLKFLAAVIGGAIVASIFIAIKWLKFIITIFSHVVRAIGWVIEKVGQVVGWFSRINEGIAKSLSGVGESIMKPFRKVFDWIDEQTQKIKGFLDRLNPFSKSSPSLVQWIQRGTDQMLKDYGDFFNKIEDMSINARPSITQAVQGASASPVAGNTINNISVDMSGIMAMSESEIREKGEIIIEAVNQGLRAKGTREIGV